MRAIRRLGLLTSSTLLLSCGNYFEQKQPDPVLEQAAVEAASSNFESVNELVFSKNCTSCHQQYMTHQGVIRELPAIQDAVFSNRMPKGGPPLSASLKTLLAAWIAKGAPEVPGVPSETGSSEPLEPTWSSLSKNVFFPKCIVCHNPQGQARFLDLSTRQTIFDQRNRVFLGGSKLADLDSPEQSYLLAVLRDEEEPMPPVSSNVSRVTEEQIRILQIWVARGMP